MKNSRKTLILILILTIAMLGLFVITQIADILKINLTTYSNIISGLR